jgi:hypothetical protein
LERQLVSIRKFSELKVRPVLVNQPALLGFLISLNSFMYLDRAMDGGEEVHFPSSFRLRSHNEGRHSQGFLLALNLWLTAHLTIGENYFASVLLLFPPAPSIFVKLSKMAECHNTNEQISSDFNKRHL